MAREERRERVWRAGLSEEEEGGRERASAREGTRRGRVRGIEGEERREERASTAAVRARAVEVISLPLFPRTAETYDRSSMPRVRARGLGTVSSLPSEFTVTTRGEKREEACLECRRRPVRQSRAADRFCWDW